MKRRMHDHLHNLEKEICSFRTSEGEHPRAESYIRDATVVFMAGGESSRFQTLNGNTQVHKASYILPTGDTMIERAISLFAELGFKRFVALVYHNADSIIKRLGDGSSWGVSIAYSHDPEKPVGKGGAVRHALEQNIIPPDKPFIVYNPDDQIVEDAHAILNRSISRHLFHTDAGGLATVIVVKGTPYTFTGMAVKDDKVIDISMYPFIPVPAHIGLTFFSHEVVPYFLRLFSYEQRTDFENVLFPILQKEGTLYACDIPPSAWIPVNDQKGLKKLIAALQKQAS